MSGKHLIWTRIRAICPKNIDADCGATKADIRDGGGRVRSIAGPGRSV
jgi:hypothetical protein